VTKIVQFLVALFAPVGATSSNVVRADTDRRAAVAQSVLIAASGAGISDMSSAD
jgi:hypothetical protein